MTDLETVKAEIETLGKAAEEWRKTVDKRILEIRPGGLDSGEWTEKAKRVDEAIHAAEEAKAAAERLIAAASAPGGGGAPDEHLTTYKDLLQTYMVTGDGKEHLKAARQEVKALNTLSDPAGGFFVTFDRDEEFIKVFTETSPMRQVARVQPIGNQSLKGRYRILTAAHGGWVGETQPRPATDTPEAGEWEIFAKEHYCYPEASVVTLEDATFNAEEWLRTEVLETLAVQENLAFVLGNGNKRPRGFMTYPDGTSPLAGQIERLQSATDDVFATEDVITLQDLLKEPYQLNASWAMHRLNMSRIRLFTAGTAGGPLWQPGLQLGVPSTILGKPFTLFQDMVSTAGDQDLILAYGDFRQCYRIVDRRGITVLRDPFTNKGFVGFYTTKRVGGDVVNYEAIKILEIQ